MQKFLEATGESRDAAIANALRQLGLDRDDFAWVQTFTSFQLSEKFSTASMIKSTTAPTA